MSIQETERLTMMFDEGNIHLVRRGEKVSIESDVHSGDLFKGELSSADVAKVVGWLERHPPKPRLKPLNPHDVTFENSKVCDFHGLEFSTYSSTSTVRVEADVGAEVNFESRIKAEEARKLGEWLIAAADFIESQR